MDTSGDWAGRNGPSLAIAIVVAACAVAAGDKLTHKDTGETVERRFLGTVSRDGVKHHLVRRKRGKQRCLPDRHELVKWKQIRNRPDHWAKYPCERVPVE
jgi:hypothetical protein